ncbi:N-acetyltransferase family protein [Sphingobium sp. AN558]|uniref:GNAT family N-acetyltransferase n=1 Tax=Sphingobium sp. AN558 TaxID=3133442 RepID=UPI0030C181BB
MHIRRVRANDAAAIASLYRPFVEDSRISFELIAPDAEEIGRRIGKCGDAYPYLVAEGGDGVLGYAYATAFRDRPAYRFAVETSIYLSPHAQGCGLGRRLYTALLDILTAQGFVHAIGAVTMPNDASTALHLAMGYATTGVYRDIGFKQDAWASVQLFQKTLHALPDTPQEPLPLSACPAWTAIPA